MDVDLDGVARFCEMFDQNSGQWSYQARRLTLRALDIKVAVTPENLTIRGSLPGQPDLLTTYQFGRPVAFPRETS